MTTLLSLALQSLTDPDAAQVLGDHVLETQWFDPRVPAILNQGQFHRVHGGLREKDHFDFAARGVQAWARAVAAVLLLQSWPDADAWTIERGPDHYMYPWWPVVSRCAINDSYESRLNYYGLNRSSTDPLRLAGKRFQLLLDLLSRDKPRG